MHPLKRRVLKTLIHFKRAPKTIQIFVALAFLSVLSLCSPAWPYFTYVLTPYLNLPILQQGTEASIIEFFRFVYVLANHPTLLETLHWAAIMTLSAHLVYMILMITGARYMMRRLELVAIENN